VPECWSACLWLAWLAGVLAGLRSPPISGLAETATKPVLTVIGGTSWIPRSKAYLEKTIRSLKAGEDAGQPCQPEAGIRAPVRVAYQIGASPIQSNVKLCS